MYQSRTPNRLNTKSTPQTADATEGLKDHSTLSPLNATTESKSPTPNLKLHHINRRQRSDHPNIHKTPTSPGQRRQLNTNRCYPNIIQNAINSIPNSAGWLSGALPSILKADIGSEYDKLIVLLIEFESTNHYTTQRSSRFYTTDRPVEIKKWVSNARGRRGTVIEITDVSAYSERWWKWWISLQPNWRIYDKKGRPIVTLQQNSPADWTPLIVHGANGFLGVVASLYWWGFAIKALNDKEKEKYKKDWDKAIIDCKWVLRCILEMKRENAREDTESPTSAEESDDEVDELDE